MGLPGYYIDVPGNLVTLPVAPRWGDPVNGAEVLDILLETGGGKRHSYQQATRAIRSFAFRFSRADKADFLTLHRAVTGRSIPFFFVPDTDDMTTFLFCRKEKDFRPREVPSEAVIAGSVTSLFDYVLELTAEPAVLEVGVMTGRGTSTAQFIADQNSFLTAEGSSSVDLIGESIATGELVAPGVADSDLVGRSTAEGVLAAAGAAAENLVGVGRAEGVLSGAGIGAAAFVTPAEVSGVLSAAGIGASSLVGVAFAWSQIGGDSLNSGWSGGTNVNLASGGSNHIYAAISGTAAGDAELWEWNGSTWTKIGGDGVNSSWNTNYETCGSPTYRASDGHVFLCLGNSTGDAEVWEWNGSSWTKIGGDGLNSSWNTNYEAGLTMCFDASGNLIVGLGTGDQDAEVYQWDGATWTKIGGDGVNSSWAAAGNYNQTRGLTLHDDGGGSAIFIGLGVDAGEGEVWRFRSGSWTKIGGDGLNSSFTSELVNGLWSFNSKLYAGIGNTAANGGQVWEWNGTAWTNISGFGTGYERAFAFATLNGKLYVGLGSGAGDADVWEYSGAGTTWTKVGGDGLANSWATNYELVTGLIGHTDGNMYAGLGTSSGDAEVWRWLLTA